MADRSLSVTTIGPLSKESGIDPALVTELSSLICPGDEECSLLVKEWTPTGVAVFLKRQKLVSTEDRWIRDHDPVEHAYYYAALFETETTPEIVGAIRRVLEMPGLA
jgi:hypothetical protein